MSFLNIKSHKSRYAFFILLILSLIVSACSSSEKAAIDEEETLEENVVVTDENVTIPAETADLIFSVAAVEQDNKMYSKNHDSTYLYWLENRLIILKNTTKCNIFAINTLHKAGFKTPSENVLTYDLMDTDRFNDIFPVINITDLSEIKRGDLLVWHGHVIIFERLVHQYNRYFAQAWWAGTRQADNGVNIRNNVIYGRYPLDNMNFVVRRPVFAGF